MKIDVYEQTRIALEQYGRNGDGSFECVGWTQVGDEIAEYKIYRYFQRDQLHDYVFNNSAEFKELLKKMIRLQQETCLHLFDISIRKWEQGTSLRAVYKLNHGCSEQEQEKSIEKYAMLFLDAERLKLIRVVNSIIKPILSPNRNPLTQLGVEITEQGEIIISKLYFLLKDTTGEKWNSQYPAKDKVISIMKELFENIGIDKSQMQDLQEYIGQLEKYRYCPFLLGINHSSNEVELKLYVVLNTKKQLVDDFVKLEESLLKESRIGRSVTWTSHEQLKQMDSLGLYMKGLALCVNVKQKDVTWKIYFMPKKQKGK